MAPLDPPVSRFVFVAYSFRGVTVEQSYVSWSLLSKFTAGIQGTHRHQSSSFWDMWKSFDDKYQNDSQPRLTDGNVWEQYYAKLFQQNNDLQPTKWANEIKKDYHGPALNKQISDREIQKSVQRLKKGKSPGMDRISNEMIIASYPIMKDAFHKLFNFIFSSRNVPEI